MPASVWFYDVEINRVIDLNRGEVKSIIILCYYSRLDVITLYYNC